MEHRLKSLLRASCIGTTQFVVSAFLKDRLVFDKQKLQSYILIIDIDIFILAISSTRAILVSLRLPVVSENVR
jgi:hypothetical protein